MLRLDSGEMKPTHVNFDSQFKAVLSPRTRSLFHSGHVCSRVHIGRSSPSPFICIEHLRFLEGSKSVGSSFYLYSF